MNELTFQERYKTLWFITDTIGNFVGELVLWNETEWLFRQTDSRLFSSEMLNEIKAVLDQLNETP